MVRLYGRPPDSRREEAGKIAVCVRGRRNLRSAAVVVPKHATESFAAFDLAAGLANVPLGLDQLVVQALMISLRVIMNHELEGGPSQ